MPSESSPRDRHVDMLSQSEDECFTEDLRVRFLRQAALQRLPGFYYLRLESDDMTRDNFALSHMYTRSEDEESDNQLKIILQERLNPKFGFYVVYCSRLEETNGPALMAFRLVGYCSPSSSKMTSETSNMWLCSNDAQFKSVEADEKDVLNQPDFVWVIDHYEEKNCGENCTLAQQWTVRLTTCKKSCNKAVLAPTSFSPMSFMDIVTDPCEETLDSALITAYYKMVNL